MASNSDAAVNREGGSPGEHSGLDDGHDVDEHLLVLHWQHCEVDVLHRRPDDRLRPDHRKELRPVCCWQLLQGMVPHQSLDDHTEAHRFTQEGRFQNTGQKKLGYIFKCCDTRFASCIRSEVIVVQAGFLATRRARLGQHAHAPCHTSEADTDYTAGGIVSRRRAVAGPHPTMAVVSDWHGSSQWLQRHTTYVQDDNMVDR